MNENCCAGLSTSQPTRRVVGRPASSGTFISLLPSEIDGSEQGKIQSKGFNFGANVVHQNSTQLFTHRNWWQERWRLNRAFGFRSVLFGTFSSEEKVQEAHPGQLCQSGSNVAAQSFKRNEDGYTLLETVVAMALFVSVLIPLGAAIGNLMLDNSADQIRTALHIAESELASIVPEQAVAGTTTQAINKLIVERTTEKRERLVRVKVSVASIKKPGKFLVSLHKSFLIVGRQ